MRIAYLVHQSGVGSEKVVVNLLAALDRDRFEPLVVLPAEGPLRAEIEALGVPVHVLPLGWWIPATHWSASDFLAQLAGLGGRVDALTALLERERIDLVHTHFIVTLEGALAAARLGVPHVWHSRGFFGGGFPPAWFDDTGFFFSVVDLLADVLICVSRGVAAQAATVCRLVSRQVIYDGFDLEAFLARPVESPAALRARYGFEPSDRVVACVGGIQRRKGQLDLIEAAAPLVREFPHLILALAGVAGDAEYLAALETRIAELGLERHVRRIGFEPSIRNLFSVSEALVHPSHSEGGGLAILEAMAVGLPVVATRCGGPEEIVEDGVSGLLVPVGNPQELGGAIRRLLADPEGARAMGRAAAGRARGFSPTAMARRTGEIYEGLSPISGETRALRARLADFVMDELLTRAHQTVGAAADPRSTPPPAPRTPPRGSWPARLRKRFGGSIP
ncbi:MAG TPA: glycosyltransferase family 4 protein [Thermoanaerobaculia bacterium]|jgi:glycosyltransferase involved in cell wall biosynthesis|nr:glycosyltransferase family 4 protein [Thermoanaerobaculia bacterium]